MTRYILFVVPTRPRDVRLSSPDPQIITVTWREPKYRNGIITRYNITYIGRKESGEVSQHFNICTVHTHTHTHTHTCTCGSLYINQVCMPNKICLIIETFIFQSYHLIHFVCLMASRELLVLSSAHASVVSMDIMCLYM